MKGSRITAIGLVAAAGLWIVSGHFMPHESAESRAAIRPGEADAKKLFRVAVMQTSEGPHARKLTISGRTQADKRVTITARSGAMPKLDLVNLEAQLKASEAGLAAAEAERDRGVLRAPWAGVINDVPVEIGQAAFSMAGREIATLVGLDPMLAVVEVSERKLAGVKVGDLAEVRLVTGESASGKIRFVAKTASQTTRTYRIEIELPNADAKIPDGITAEVAMPLSPTPATRIPRSALTFSSTGNLGGRAVGAHATVELVRGNVVGDEPGLMWVTGISEGSRVIVQGQDFVREGQKVDAVMMPALTAVA